MKINRNDARSAAAGVVVGAVLGVAVLWATDADGAPAPRPSTPSVVRIMPTGDADGPTTRPAPTIGRPQGHTSRC